jgi:hypothetical protein
MFWRNILLPALGLKNETVCSSETLVFIYMSTWHYYPEDQHQHLHCHKNHKSHIIFWLYIKVSEEHAVSIFRVELQKKKSWEDDELYMDGWMVRPGST